MKGGSDKNELWCVEQLDRAEKKAQNSIFVRPALHGANIFDHLYHQTAIWQSFHQPLQLVLNIFVTSCPFCD